MPQPDSLNTEMLRGFYFFEAGLLAIVCIMAAVLLWRVKGDGPREKSLIHFAAVILTTLALIFLLSMAMFYFGGAGQETAGAKIFDRCAQIIPPIVTLVVGYFFGRQEVERRPRQDQNPRSKQTAPDTLTDPTERDDQLGYY